MHPPLSSLVLLRCCLLGDDDDDDDDDYDDEVNGKIDECFMMEGANNPVRGSLWKDSRTRQKQREKGIVVATDHPKAVAPDYNQKCL